MISEKYTFPKTNTVPQNGWWEDEFFFGFPAYFQGPTVGFVGCIQWIFLTHHPEVGTLGPDGGHLHISVANKERNFRWNLTAMGD